GSFVNGAVNLGKAAVNATVSAAKTVATATVNTVNAIGSAIHSIGSHSQPATSTSATAPPTKTVANTSSTASKLLPPSGSISYAPLPTLPPAVQKASAPIQEKLSIPGPNLGEELHYNAANQLVDWYSRPVRYQAGKLISQDGANLTDAYIEVNGVPHVVSND